MFNIANPSAIIMASLQELMEEGGSDLVAWVDAPASTEFGATILAGLAESAAAEGPAAELAAGVLSGSAQFGADVASLAMEIAGDVVEQPAVQEALFDRAVSFADAQAQSYFDGLVAQAEDFMEVPRGELADYIEAGNAFVDIPIAGAAFTAVGGVAAGVGNILGSLLYEAGTGNPFDVSMPGDSGSGSGGRPKLPAEDTPVSKKPNTNTNIDTPLSDAAFEFMASAGNYRSSHRRRKPYVTHSGHKYKHAYRHAYDDAGPSTRKHRRLDFGAY